MSTKKRILFVDDEPMILKSLQRSLHSQRQVWHMSFATSGEEALEVLDKAPFDVIVTDIHMPEMNGAELLEAVRQRYPQLVRIALSGHASKVNLLLCTGPVHRFLTKPTDVETLKAIIDHVIELRGLLATEKLQKVTMRLTSLPSPQSLCHELLEELQSPEASLTKVAHFILQDIGMSTKVLHLVNSAFFGVERTVTSIEQAVKLLGLDIIKAMVLSVQLLKLFDEKRLENFSLNRVWDHSLTVASYARQIANLEKAEQPMVHDAFFAGLLHDVGKLVLAAEIPEDYGMVLKLTTENEMPLVEAEQEILEATHAEVGAYLLGLWGFSNPVIEAIAFHHAPAKGRDKGLSAVTAVHVANVLANTHGQTDQAGTEPRVDMDYLDQLELTDRLVVWQETCCQDCSKNLIEGGKVK